jgi:hypothetical protein
MELCVFVFVRRRQIPIAQTKLYYLMCTLTHFHTFILSFSSENFIIIADIS